MIGAAPGASLAADAPPFLELLRQAQASAPQLAESVAQVDVAKGEAEQAGVRPNPSVALAFENVGAKDSAGISQEETTLSASQVIELGGKRAARIDAGSAEVAAAQARQVQTRTQFAYDLAVAYADAETAQRRLRIVEEDLARAREDERVATALVEAGKEADLRGVQARAARASVDADLKQAQSDATVALGRLSTLAGVATPYSGLGGSLLSAPSKPLVVAPVVAPSVAVAEAERRAAQSRLQIEQTRRTPDLTLSLGARRLEGPGDTGLVGGISAPLPLFDRNRGAVAAARSRVAAAEARLNVARLDAETESRAAALQIAASEARLAAASQAEQAAQQAYRMARLGYDGGKTPLSEVLVARRSVNEAQNRVLDAQLARTKAQATYARLNNQTPFGE